MKKCTVCGAEKPLAKFVKRTFGSGNVGTRPYCKMCMNDKMRDKAREDRRKQRAVDPERFKKYHLEYKKTKQYKKTKAEQKRKWNIKRAEKKGKRYRTKEERHKETTEKAAIRAAEIEKRRADRAAKGRYGDIWIRRLRQELPDMYDESLCRETLIFRARYHLDQAFRAKQIERTSKRDSRYPLMNDGSLTPEVMRLLFSRKECPYCGKRMESTDKTLDHVVPSWHGGWHSKNNTIVCCYSCNSKKRAKTPEQWLKCIDDSRRNHVRKEWQGVGVRAETQGWLLAING